MSLLHLHIPTLLMVSLDLNCPMCVTANATAEVGPRADLIHYMAGAFGQSPKIMSNFVECVSGPFQRLGGWELRACKMWNFKKLQFPKVAAIN